VGLAVHPSICCGIELLHLDLPTSSQGQIIDEHQQMLSDQTQGAFRSALSGAMSEIAAALFQQRSGLMTLDCAWILKELVEHSRSPG
jgi:hypothetical protein